MLECSAFLPRAMDSAEPVVEAPRDSGCWEASECSAREGKPADAVPAGAVGRVAWKHKMPFFSQGAKSRPRERMLRTSWPSDSSKAKYRQRSPRRPEADWPEAEPVEVADRRAVS